MKKKKPTIKAIVFDYGGVMINDSDEDIIKNIADKFGMSYAETLGIIRELVKPYQKGEISGEEFWRQFSVIAKKELPKSYNSLWLDKFNARTDGQMVELVKKLKSKGFQVALLSNTISPHAKKHRINGHYDLFEPVILSFEVGARKSEEKIFKIMLDKLNFSAENCVYIDDVTEFVNVAEKIGMHGIKFDSYQKLLLDFQELGVDIA